MNRTRPAQNMTAEVKPSQFSTKNYRRIKTGKQAFLKTRVLGGRMNLWSSMEPAVFSSVLKEQLHCLTKEAKLTHKHL